MKKILVESSVLEQDRLSGVNYFASGLVGGLEHVKGEDCRMEYFWLNFLGKRAPKNAEVKLANDEGRLRQLRLIPQRVYAKLVYAGIAPPLPVGKADWQLYPNFYIWPTLARSKKAVIIHDIGFMNFPEYVEDKNQKFLARVAVKSMKKADLIISNSAFTASEIIKSGLTTEDKIITIDIPVDERDFRREDDKGREYLKERYGVTKDYILSLGTLEPRKNLTTLVEAYCELPKDIRDRYSLVLAGRWGWKVEELASLIEKKRTGGHDIVTTGYVEEGDKGTFYFHASYYAITTHYEGFGMPLLEALYTGLPAVAVDIPILREVGEDACLWVEKDVESVRAGLERLITDKALAGELSRAGQSRVAAFSWEKTARKLYERLFPEERV